MVNGRKGEVFGGEVGGDRWSLEAEFVKVILIFEDGEVGVESFDFVERPGVEKEEAIGESIFEAVGGEIRSFVVGEREKFVIGDFAGEDAVFFELAGDGFGITDDLGCAFFDRFLGFGVAVHIVNAMLEGGSGDVVEEGCEGLLFIAGEVPDDESDADAVRENGVEVLEVVNATIIDAVDHADAGEALEFGGGDVFEKPGGELGTEDFEVFACFGCEGFEGFIFASGDVEGFVGVAAEETAFSS